jgi:golgi apparatus protein 1
VQDYRLNFRLNKACSKDIEKTCKNKCSTYLGQACGGTVLRCLQDNMDKLQNDECKEEVFYFVKMEVSDFRNDVILAEACKGDVDSYCADVEPGEGRVIECLRMHRCAALLCFADRCQQRVQ